MGIEIIVLGMFVIIYFIVNYFSDKAYIAAIIGILCVIVLQCTYYERQSYAIKTEIINEVVDYAEYNIYSTDSRVTLVYYNDNLSKVRLMVNEDGEIKPKDIATERLIIKPSDTESPYLEMKIFGYTNLTFFQKLIYGTSPVKPTLYTLYVPESFEIEYMK